jgi:hypothetical protein
MDRKLVWRNRETFQGWACSQCSWEFEPSDLSFDELTDDNKRHYDRRCEDEFRQHLCYDSPRAIEGN